MENIVPFRMHEAFRRAREKHTGSFVVFAGKQCTTEKFTNSYAVLSLLRIQVYIQSSCTFILLIVYHLQQ